jgi:hypothetical protein
MVDYFAFCRELALQPPVLPSALPMTLGRDVMLLGEDESETGTIAVHYLPVLISRSLRIMEVNIRILKLLCSSVYYNAHRNLFSTLLILILMGHAVA